VSATQQDGDVRAFYAALGVELPGWAQTEAPVRCFADPDAHQHGDRDPSCSVNLRFGAFNCHGCGAHGGAYDAALVTGLSPREAIDLMVAHGLIDRRRRRDGPRHASPARATPRVRTPRQPTPPRAAEEPRLSVSGEQVRAWARSLSENGPLLERLRRERGWDRWVLRVLEVGFDGQRVTVPIRQEHGWLQGVLRLRVWQWQRPKVKSAFGTRLGLVPRPTPTDERLLLVEGPGDMLTARSAGLQAVAVPGADAWRTEWAAAFGACQVTVVMDCDGVGRRAAARIAEVDLNRRGARARIVDLAPERDDGYDLSDWLRGNDPGLLSAPRYEGEGYTRFARPGADLFTMRPPRAQRLAPVAWGPVPAAGSCSAGRGPGWPAC
jgi:hypothetical protein